MNYKHNKAIVMIKKVHSEDIEITYKLFESGADEHRYSVLIEMQKDNGDNEDFFISDFAQTRIIAIALFEKLCENTVLPCEVEYIYSDGFGEPSLPTV